MAAIAFGLHRHKAFYFQHSPIMVSRALYFANPFPESVAVGRYLKQHRKPGDKFTMIGNEPQIGFYASMRSSTGFMYIYPIWEEHRHNWQMLD